jgi:acyl-homoserine-lactone acylase
VVEFSSPVRAKVILTYGNSSQPDSPHNGDQLKLFSEKKMRPVWRRLSEIEANLEEREDLSQHARSPSTN